MRVDPNGPTKYKKILLIKHPAKIHNVDIFFLLVMKIILETEKRDNQTKNTLSY